MLRSTLLTVALLPAPALAATITVGPSGADHTTISAALNNANDGDVIQVAAGNYAENLLIDQLDVAIVGAGSTTTSITGGGAAGIGTLVVVNNADVQLEGFELTSAGAGRGVALNGASFTGADLDIHGLDASGLAANDGGALLCEGSVLSLTDTRMRNNTADDGGHMRLNDCDTTLVDSVLVNGDADDGGAIRMDGGVLDIRDSMFQGNSAGDDGGAIYIVDDGLFEVTRTTFEGNEAGGLGGAIQEGGNSGGGGGGTFYDLDATFTDCNFVNNVAVTGYGYGGAIYHRGYGDITITNTAFVGNQASVNGGGLRLFPDGPINITLEDNRFRGNLAGDIGGGAAIGATNGGDPSSTMAWNNTFIENESTRGGGISIDSVETVEGIGNMFCGNLTYSSGGALRLTQTGGASLIWTNSAFIENQSGYIGGGLALFESPPGGAGSGDPAHEFWNNSFAGNGSPEGGNVYAQDTKADFVNNIFAFASDGNGFVGDPGVPGAMDYNLWYGNQPADTGGGVASGDLGTNAVFSDPLFQAFNQDGVCGNDLLTLDVGSPAIDAGDPNVADPDGTRSDIGAFGGPDVDPGAIVDNDNDGWPGIADCDDNDANVNPDADEVCGDQIDNNCDGGVDDAAALTAQDWYPDFDNDGYGDDGAVIRQCDAPDGYIAAGGDCDDGDDTVNPDASEVCDQADNDCNGTVDDGLTTTYYTDGDGDGFGDIGAPVTTCDPQPAGTATNGEDCDDSNDLVNPSAEEICDELDNDCDTEVDEGLTSKWFRDADADGFGNDDKTTDSCIQPSGFVPQGGDCDDNNPDISPAAEDRITDGIDQNCDGNDGAKNSDEDLIAISGCGCDTATGTGTTGWLALLGALALFRRRR